MTLGKLFCRCVSQMCVGQDGAEYSHSLKSVNWNCVPLHVDHHFFDFSTTFDSKTGEICLSFWFKQDGKLRISRLLRWDTGMNMTRNNGGRGFRKAAKSMPRHSAGTAPF